MTETKMRREWRATAQQFAARMMQNDDGNAGNIWRLLNKRCLLFDYQCERADSVCDTP